MNSVSSRDHRFLLGLVMALVMPFIVVSIHISLKKYLVVNEWVLLYPTVFFVAWYGGLGPGILCTVVSAFSAGHYLIRPERGFSVLNLSDIVNVATYIFMGVSLSFLMRKYRITEEAERKAYELQKSQGFLDSLLENIPNMVFVKEAKNLRFVRFNKAGEELIGQSRDVMMGKNDYDFFPTDQAEFFTMKDREVLKGRKIVDIPEEKIQTKDQGIRILHTKKIPIYNDAGEAAYLLGISEDITEVKLRERELLRVTAQEGALREREKHNRTSAFLGEASTILSSSLNYHKTLEELTKLAVPVLGDWCIVAMKVSPEKFERVAYYHRDPEMMSVLKEFMTKHPFGDVANLAVKTTISGQSLFQPIMTDEILDDINLSPEETSFVKRLKNRSLIVVPIVARNEVIGNISFVSSSANRVFEQDDLWTAEELGRRAGVAIDNALLYATSQEAIATRDEFLSIASHELKTPITSLKLQFQMAERAMHPGSKKDFDSVRLSKLMGLSLKQIDRLAGLIDDLLDVSRIRAGKMTINPEFVNLSTLIHEVIEQNKDQLERAGSQLILNLDDSIEARWDEARIQQVIINLISNAVKYAPGTPVEITTESHGETCTISVRDHGPGIPMQNHNVIFERFERAQATREISGLGLGLYIVRQIVEAHAGHIFVDSTVTDGARIVVELPRVSPTQSIDPTGLEATH